VLTHVRYTQKHPRLCALGLNVSFIRVRLLVVLIIVPIVISSVSFCSGQDSSKSHAKKFTSQPAPATAPQFPPVQQWETAINSKNSGVLKALYSSAPPARIITPSGESNVEAEAAFWTTLSPRNMKVHIVQAQSPQPGTEQVLVKVEVQASGTQTTYMEMQLWQEQNQQWRLVASKRAEPARLEQPASTSKDIYPAGVDAHAEIKEALEKAGKEHKRVLVVFGANWCYDCHVLDLAFHRPDIAPLLNSSYEVVHIDIGEGEKNQDLMQQYQVPMKKGIPALAVLESDGKLLYSQKNGEFEKARALGPEDLIQFLKKWKPQPRQSARS
jgi:thioredoxin 1